MDFPDIRAVLDYKNVESYLAKQVPKANWGATIINMALTAIIGGIISIIVAVLRPIVSNMLPSIAGTGMAALSSGGMGIGMTIAVLVGGFVGFFIMGCVLHLMAKAFGGTGSMVQLIYMMSIISLAIVPISALFALLSVIPCVSCIISIGLLALLAYIYYLYYIIIKMVYKLDSKKAIMALAAYFVLIIVAVLIILGIFIALALYITPSALRA